jgi:iron complex outermembrane recepter protein
MRCQLLILIISSLSVWAVMPAQANESVPKSDPLVKRPIPTQPATTVEQLQVQIAQSLVEVTGVAIEPTETGFNLVLNASAPLSVPPTRVEGNALIAEIDNAVLTETFDQANPTAEIARVRVVVLEGNRIQVMITGVEKPPTAKIIAVATGLSVAVTARAGSTAVEAEEEEELVVTGQQEGGYAVPNASVGTRTDAPLRDVPQSIQVVPRQVIEDQGATTLSDILRNVSGVSETGEELRIRGFNIGNFSNNGLGFGGASGRGSGFDFNNVEQFEVLKGPASVLYGSGGPGGAINITTKQPLKDPFYELKATVGNYDFYRPTVDLTGPLNDVKTILYRLTAAYENSGSFTDFVENESFSISPTLSFQLGENTKLTLEGSYESTSGLGSPGLVAEGLVLPNPFGQVPRSRYLGEPDFNRQNFSSSYVGYRLEHQFSDSWSLRNQFRASFARNKADFIFLEGLEDQRTVLRSASRFDNSGDNYTLQTELLGDVQTGIVQHNLLFGVDLGRNVSEGRQTFTEIAPIDLFEPEYGAKPGDLTLPKGSFFTSYAAGVYVQDLLSIGKQVKVLLGGRFDWSRSNTLDRDANTETTSEDTAFTPRVGIVYQPIDPVSLYASWSRSFEPQPGVDEQGNPFLTITGEQFEVGVKTEFLNGKLAATLSAYQIARQNDFTDDPDRPGFSIQIGEQRSRGIDFNISGEPILGLRLIASYAYIDAKITKDTTGLEGNQLGGVPQHSGGLWAVYEIQNGGLKGLGFGTGIFVIGDRFGFSDNEYIVPSYARTDALLYYKRDNWKVQLNIDNLFDVVYFEGTGRAYGEPLTIRGQVSVTF